MHTLNHGTTSCLDGSDIWPNQENLGESHHFFFFFGGGGGGQSDLMCKNMYIQNICTYFLKYMYLSYIYIYISQR